MSGSEKHIVKADLAAPICRTCGTQFPPGDAPEDCPICNDERQYVGRGGQQWTTLANMTADHQNELHEQEPGLIGIGTKPQVAIGQRALLVQTAAGNLLWDCLSYVDEDTIDAVEALGGVSAIAISHPHYFSSMVTWSRAFGGVPIHLHEKSRKWVVRDDPAIRYWTGDSVELAGALTLYNTGGHFAGYQVLHWPKGADGAGVLLSGDQPTVCADKRWVSFMYSYPNYIPLAASTVTRILRTLEPLEYDRIYGAWWESIVGERARDVVGRSADRYIRAISDRITRGECP